MKRHLFLLLFTCLTVALAGRAFGRHITPKPVTAVQYQGVIYSAPPFIHDPSGKEFQRGGYVEAHAVSTARLLWRVRIYKTWYNPLKEPDTQDVFITDLTLQDGALIITDEKHRRFRLDLATRRSIRIR